MVSLPGSSKSNLLLFPGCRGRRRQQTPSPVVSGPSSTRPESGEGQSAPVPTGNTLHPLAATSISGRKTFPCTAVTSRFPLGPSGTVRTPFQGKNPHITFWPFEKCITKTQICSACCPHTLTMAFAVQPRGALKALSLECSCV